MKNTPQKEQKLQRTLSKFFDRTFWKFIVVGVVNTLFGATIMFVFFNVLHLDYWLSSASNYLFASILSYFLNKHFTFRSQDRSLKGVLKFILNIVVCYLLAYGLAKPLALWVLSGASPALQDNIAMLVGMCLFVALNYVGQRFFVFKSADDATDKKKTQKTASD